MTDNGDMKSTHLSHISRIDTTPLHERVYADLRAGIMRGQFAPGMPLTVRELAKAFGTSNMPVRDALGRLVVERALEMPSSRAFRIPIMTHEQFMQLCRFRMVVEGYAAAQAAEHITDAEVADVEAHDASITAATKAMDVPQFLNHNLVFTLAVYKAAKIPLILPHIESLWLQHGPYLILRAKRLLENSKALRAGSVGHHAELLAALRKRDATRASKAVVSDIRETSVNYLLPKDFRAPA